MVWECKVTDGCNRDTVLFPVVVERSFAFCSDALGETTYSEVKSKKGLLGVFSAHLEKGISNFLGILKCMGSDAEKW